MKKLSLLLTALAISATTAVAATPFDTLYDMVTETKENIKEMIPKLHDIMLGIHSTGGFGSGYIAPLAKDGTLTVLTDQHVVGDDTVVNAYKQDGTQVLLYVLKTDKRLDLALLSTDKNAKATYSSDEAKKVFKLAPMARVGSTVFVYGHPQAERATVTKGTVTAHTAIVRPTEGTGGNPLAALLGGKQAKQPQPSVMLSLSALAMAGNSGGPVLDPAGHLVGLLDLGYEGDVTTKPGQKMEDTSLKEKIKLASLKGPSLATSSDEILEFLTATPLAKAKEKSTTK